MKVSLRAVVTFTFNKGTASFQTQSHGQGKPPFTDYWTKASIFALREKACGKKEQKRRHSTFSLTLLEMTPQILSHVFFG